MKKIIIERVTLNDLDVLQDISRMTFYRTYASANTEEDINAYLESNFSIENLKKELSCETSEFYFAKHEGKIIGYLKVNLRQPKTIINSKIALEVERIYVLEEFQGNKIGEILIKKAIEISKQKKAKFIWLGVWEKNTKAIQFYKKNGFIEFDKHIFRLGTDEQTDTIMKLEV